MNRISVIATVMILALAGLGLSACNTAKGFGKDMEEAGESIQNM